MYHEDTIAAISTAPGEGGIGIVRVSGPDAEALVLPVLKLHCDGGLLSHRFYYGTIGTHGEGALDEVMVVLMRAPKSYTREDVMEIQCHGGTLVTERVLQLVLAQGARLAAPGEFTKRAFLNGRIDLLQAEAVIDIIRSRTDSALTMAQGQREGDLSRRMNYFKQVLLEALAILEASIDFPEDDLDPALEDGIISRINLALSEIDDLLSHFEEGRALREGVSVLIAGKPNVGKSSLLNMLLQEKRAIVTAIPGTTRDVIEEVINMQGLPVRLMDTAGIRSSDDLVEQEGIKLSLEKIPQADLVLFVLDNSRPFDHDDEAICAALAGTKFLLVVNKVDLSSNLRLPMGLAADQAVSVSSLAGHGMDQLRQRIVSIFLHDGVTDSRRPALISRTRHRDSLVKALEALRRFRTAQAEGLPAELLALELRLALEALGEVTGQTTPDDLLDLIFSQFCIGK